LNNWIFPYNKEAAVPRITLTGKNTAVYQATDIKIITSMQPNHCKENKAKKRIQIPRKKN